MNFILPLTIVVSLCFSSSSVANEFNDAIDSIMQGAIEDGAPGCNLGVIHKGSFIHKKGYGLSNLELDTPLDGTQVHRMASVSKQFTALAVLLLAEEGKIALDDDIRKHLPSLPDYGHTITINGMLGHVSGMGDYDLISSFDQEEKNPKSIELKSAAGGLFRLGNEDYLTIAEFFEVVSTVPLALEPETEFSYSNLAYFLLSMLVENVSGQSLRDYSHEHIFKPLGMKNTFFSDDPVEIVKNRAYGYKQRDDGTYVTDMTNLFWVGDGGLHTNLDDLLIWDSYFYSPKLGKDPKQLLADMNTPNSKFEAREGILYANGQFVSEENDQLVFFHSGGWLGTYTFFSRIPDKDLAIAWMCNDISNQELAASLKKVLKLAKKAF
ncbi:serine hydrolase domain-containing protein [Aliiglaciecola sp. 3_MG-2023]|uniref:serine hydrolase domain-containing protein n=1 Tax=Aliiglaciecola sp. 3_MG-2023 TaxID=3062644 RepID=UPI0026E46235|nr:serine hydrolase domain-containing protein [Aliiglaciecola sp. 3_MG-2023]MDO6695507.1 serine hydrolase domain-containing protein [Aliiglaciecola sp. 3_MG-2023]